MKQRATVAMALGGALVIALFGIATERKPVTRVDHGDLRRAAASGAVERALDAGDITAARRAWHDMYLRALDGRDWHELVEAADTHLMIAGRAGARSDDAYPRARELYLAALFRARAEGSPDGALRVAERFAALGDRDAAAMALRLADTITPRQGEAVTALVGDTLY